MVDPQQKALEALRWEQKALEALRWLREQGFDVRLAAKDLPDESNRLDLPLADEHREPFFVDLIPIADPDSVIPNYGSGMTIQRAVVAARERYAAEQV